MAVWQHFTEPEGIFKKISLPLFLLMEAHWSFLKNKKTYLRKPLWKQIGYWLNEKKTIGPHWNADVVVGF